MNNKDLPFISAKMITYGRIPTLEEALHSFLIQDYPADKCELIIVNDYPLQKLKFNHPQVKIFNLDETFPLIGEKENFTIELCKEALIAGCDDDDIAMPNHLQNVVKYWKEDTNLLHWNRGVAYNNKKISKIMTVGNSGIVYSKGAWEAIGKSPLMNAGGDMVLVVAIRALGDEKVVRAFPPDDEVSWFYYWANRSYHQSGLGRDDDTRPNVIVRNSEHIERERVKGNIPTGNIVLNPHWDIDYQQQLKDYCNEHRK